MKYFNLFLLSFLLVVSEVHAQNIQHISGSVVNDEGELLSGNALALSVEDSSLIQGASFLEEPFNITNIDRKSVLLKLTSFQFNDTIMRLDYSGETHVALGQILRQIIQLDEIEITAQTPNYINKAGGTVEVNVAKTILATSNSVTEILSKSPSVVVSEESISVLGRGEAIIYLDGIRITNERLSSINAAQVDKIDIIPNPSSKYDSEGMAVIKYQN